MIEIMKGILKEIYDSYKNDADTLNIDWKHLTKTELANGYCDYDELGDTVTRDKFFSALMYKYSYMVTLFYSRRLSVLQRLDIEDFHYWVAESLLKGLKYRRWRDPEFKELYENPNGAEVVFNRCFYSTEKRYYKYYNQDCRKLSYMTTSLDMEVFNNTEIDNDYNDNCYYNEIDYLDYRDNLVDPDSCYDGVKDLCKCIVQDYVDKGQILQALIVDGIGYQDTFKKNSVNNDTIKEKNYIFDARKLVKHLNHLDVDFIEYFNDNYKVEDNVLKGCVDNIAKTRNEKLYNIIDKTLEELRNNVNIKMLLRHTF